MTAQSTQDSEVVFDVFKEASGAIYHLGVQEGDLANDMIVVGSKARAELLAGQLLTEIRVDIFSPRLFRVFTGANARSEVGRELSIVAIGMGAPMMDFFVREMAYLKRNETDVIRVVRVGTCGLIPAALPPKTIIAATSCVFSSVDYLRTDGQRTEYALSGRESSNAELTNAVLAELAKTHPEAPIASGLNMSGEFFYATQGRRFGNLINDHNASLVDDVIKANPDLASIEMESFHLCFLANRIRNLKLEVAAFAVGVVNRSTGATIDHSALVDAEQTLGEAIAAVLCH